jgi:magnesium transporter
MTVLETELQQHLESCGIILAQLEDEIDRDQLRELLIKSKALSSFNQKALLIRNVLDELLENDEDLKGIYLSDKKLRSEERTDFGEVEMLLESYYKQCDEFVQQAESLISDIKSTEEIVNIILDANRNSLMLFELKVTIYTLGFTVATLLPAFYGMNLQNFIEESTYGFGGVVGFSILIGLIITKKNFKTLKAVQKLTLMAPGSRKTASGRTTKKKASSWSFWRRWGKEVNIEDLGQRDVVWKWLTDEKRK